MGGVLIHFTKYLQYLQITVQAVKDDLQGYKQRKSSKVHAAVDSEDG